MRPDRGSILFEAARNNSRVEIVANAGHVPQAEQLETTLGLVRDFLRVP